MRKERDARRVTFQEDYSAGKKKGTGTKDNPAIPSLTIKKGTVAAMHVHVAEKLAKRGAKLKIEKFDFKAIKERNKAAFQKRRKSELISV